MNLKYIVTGTGRCGTVYFAKLLTSLGITCGHETVFSYDGLEEANKRLLSTEPLKLSLIAELATPKEDEKKWFPDKVVNIQADSSYMAAPFLDHFDAKIIHLIRNPLEVINSFVNGLGYFRNNCIHKDDFKHYHKFIYHHTPRVLKYDNCIDRAAIYYIEWNKLIESKAAGKPYIRHNINRSLGRLFKFLNISKPTNYYNDFRSNHIYGLEKLITDFRQIPSPAVREELISFYNQCFYIKI